MFKRSIRNKLIVLLMAATIVPFGASIVITYYHTAESLKDQVIQENSNLLYQGKVNLEGYINELDGLTLSLYNNPGLINFLKDPQKENNYQAVEAVRNVISTILYAEENIKRVNIAVAKEDRLITASRRSTVVFSKKLTNTNQEYYKRAKASPSHMYLEPIHKIKEPEDKKPKNVITMHRSLINIPSNDILAYISLEFSPDQINNISRNLFLEGKEEFYILSPEGDLVYRSADQADGGIQTPDWINWIISTNKENGTVEWKEDSFSGVMVYEKLSKNSGGWYLVKRVPYTTLYESAFSVAKINIMFGVIGLFLVILATLFISFRITSPIRVLLHYIDQVEKGNLNVHFKSFGNDEVGYLGDRFKQMIDKINDLINREYKLQLENKTNQLKVLQSQVNPHFLYNALQSIGTAALKNQGPQIYSSVTRLSKIMRYSMNMEEDLVPLQKEVEHTKAYLLLQKERFGDQLQFNFQLDESALGFPVPKMILQPIVENYFKHGFDAREKTGEIKIACRQDEFYLDIFIEDNGTGVSESRLEEIQRHLMNDRIGQKGELTNIGLKNIYARLKLYYGNRAYLKLKNLEQDGLMISIKLPKRMEGGKDESNYCG
ncbi:cache domain-containing sensor histidine kinase [Cytobacillus sp. NCCP-133]|uniref:cache domain-containing sensor histidine kinase n=1 Tax=Cytobacillus sp. NCCP-133 TaxID=766848 RepID=UPI00222EEA74|nr:sensor histidine kinase [Cytobacillus sp. NCCP-133]GLB58633.1 histidine kinase [Cytobacillus sp. NCCP-133]